MVRTKDVRTIFFDMKARGHSMAEISACLKVGRTTLWRWNKQGVEPFRRPKARPAARKLSPATSKALQEYFAADAATTLQQAACWLKATFNITISLQSVSAYCKYVVHALQRLSFASACKRHGKYFVLPNRMPLQRQRGLLCQELMPRVRCRRFGFTVKKATKAYKELNQQKAAEFLHSIQNDFNPSFLALDEAAFLYNHVTGYAWSKKGVRAVVKRPGIRGKAHSLLLCISTAGVVFFRLYEGAVTAQRFIEFLHQLPQGSTLVLDNAKIHHATNVLKRQNLPTVREVAAQQTITMRYLPAYAPKLNPVELCFNTIRTYVNRERPRTATQLHSCIESAVLTLNARVCQATIAKVYQLTG